MIDTDRTRALIDRIWNQGDLDAIDELYSDNFAGHDPQNPVQGRDGVRAWVEESLTAAPDIHINMHESIAEGDMMVLRWTASGTLQKDWRGIPASGQPFVVTGMTMSKYDGDKIVESWANSDNLGMLQQLGVIPAEATTG